ncbi:MAG: hypothetical protein N3G75_06275 [Methanothrix sp.]|nr:hypothetical protein [Methanothrix sp.]MCX8207421.1 hypothetical protein [Methanothrix sp.]
MAKPITLSRTFWLNVIALVAIVLQDTFGFVITPEEQMAILAVVNIFVRLLTKEEIRLCC